MNAVDFLIEGNTPDQVRNNPNKKKIGKGKTTLHFENKTDYVVTIDFPVGLGASVNPLTLQPQPHGKGSVDIQPNPADIPAEGCEYEFYCDTSVVEPIDHYQVKRVRPPRLQLLAGGPSSAIPFVSGGSPAAKVDGDPIIIIET